MDEVGQGGQWWRRILPPPRREADRWDLLGRCTFDWRDQNIWPWRFHGAVYNADGHGVFDSITVYAEFLVHNVLAFPATAYGQGSEATLERVWNLIGHPPETSFGGPFEFFYFYLPHWIGGAIWEYSVAITWLYDLYFHDVPVLGFGMIRSLWARER